MLRVIFLAAVLWAACSAADLQAETAESRRLLSEAEQAIWPSVGRLNVSGQGFCTATLIAPDLVLTAAHCLVDRRNGRVVRAARVHFLAGYRIGTYRAHGRAAAISLAPRYLEEPDSILHDLALVRLRQPMAADIPPLRLSQNLGAGHRLDTLSYGIDRSHALAQQSGCSVEMRREALVLTDCEGAPGVSGAPLLRWLPDGPYLVAVGAALLRESGGGVPRGPLLAVGVTDAVIGEMRAGLGGG